MNQQKNLIKGGQSNPDTNLEIALALSASLAQSDGQPCGSHKLVVPEVIYPEATVWPIRYVKTSENGKSNSHKTVLQVKFFHSFLIRN